MYANTLLIFLVLSGAALNNASQTCDPEEDECPGFKDTIQDDNSAIQTFSKSIKARTKSKITKETMTVTFTINSKDEASTQAEIAMASTAFPSHPDEVVSIKTTDSAGQVYDGEPDWETGHFPMTVEIVLRKLDEENDAAKLAQLRSGSSSTRQGDGILFCSAGVPSHSGSCNNWLNKQACCDCFACCGGSGGSSWWRRLICPLRGGCPSDHGVCHTCAVFGCNIQPFCASGGNYWSCLLNGFNAALPQENATSSLPSSASVPEASALEVSHKSADEALVRKSGDC